MDMTYRASCRTQVTKVCNAANDYLSSITGLLEDETPRSKVIDDLTILLARLKTSHKNLNEANITVRSTIKPEQYQVESDAIIEYEDKAIIVIAKLERMIQNQQRLIDDEGFQAPTNGIATHGNPNTSRQGHSPNRSSTAKLPKLDLKKFNGDFNSWLPFWEQFKTVIHENNSLDAPTKFCYLQSTLIGKAAATISGFTPTESCYLSAIELLKEEYGSTERIIDHYMEKLMSIQSVKSKSDNTGLRQIYNSVTSVMRSLEALGVPATQYNVMLKSVLLRALPPELRIEFHRQALNDETASASTGETTQNGSSSDLSSICLTDGDKQVKRLLKFIKREVESLEKSFQHKSEHHTKRNEYGRVLTHTTGTATSLLTPKLNSSADRICLFCSSSQHKTAECDSDHTLEHKKEVLKQKNRCLRCTKPNHYAKYCRNRQITCRRCKGRHVTSLCDPTYTPAKSTTNTGVNPNENALNLSATNVKQERVFIQTACAFIVSPTSKEKLFIRLVLDDGSMKTYIKGSVSRKLNLPVVKNEKVSIIPFGCAEVPPGKMCSQVKFYLKSQYGENNLIEIKANEVEHICLDVLPVPNVNNVQFSGLELADSRQCNDALEDGITLLIGADYYWAIVNGYIERVNDKLAAVCTKLGWTLLGPADADMCDLKANSHALISLQVNCIKSNFSVEKFWDLETIGIREKNEKNDTEFAVEYMNDFVQRKGDRYIVRLPWMITDKPLDSNYSRALSHAKSITQRLGKIEQKLLEYDRAIWEYISNGIAEPVKAEMTGSRVYYMPHRPVYRGDKVTTKVRVVFNASSHGLDSLSLNDHLHAGTKLLPDMIAILLNFRVGRIGMTADIEKAFLQIVLADDERDSHRFIWYAEKIKNNSTALPPFQIYRMTRVTFGVNSSPFILNATIKKHLMQMEGQYSQTCQILRRCLYVDDFITSIDDPSEAQQIHKEAKLIMSKAGMNLRKWRTNDSALQGIISDSAQEDIERTPKVLGLCWYDQEDEIGVDITTTTCFINTLITGTKRKVLQAIQKIYDPLGMISPHGIKARMLMQKIWRRNLGWDVPLPEDLSNIWNEWCQDFSSLEGFTLPRCILADSSINRIETQLHVFSDASPDAYGAVSYVRSFTVTGKIEVNFLFSKARVAPIKQCGDNELTVPKLELAAALIASRLVHFIVTNMNVKFDKIYLWSDSKIVLYWIAGNPQRWKQYVSNRVREIRAMTENVKFRHCPGKSNPADLLTRKFSAKIFIESKFWLHGPEWLSGPESGWPNEEEENVDIAAPIASLQAIVSDKTNVEPVIKIEEFSQLRRLLRVTAYLMRYLHNIRQVHGKLSGELSAGEVQKAEIYWIKAVQAQEYGSELATLIDNKLIDSNSKILMLCPILDTDGILRVNSRLEYAESMEAKPIILPKSYMAQLLIREAHEKNFHAGINATLAKLRERFWIVKGRQLIKATIRKCIICQRLYRKCAKEPFAPLPRDRIIVSKPFEITGLDFAGPLYVMDPVDDRNSKKVYLLLLTCATVRAVHLEIVQDMSTESFLRALRRFVARRGLPNTIYSDNAKTFKRSELELKKLFDIATKEKWSSYASAEGITWKFIPERAPWWGGWWERLVRTIKNALKAAIGKNRLNLEDLQTVSTEIEAMINSRPLTYMTDDPRDLIPLTPFHILLGFTRKILPAPEKLTEKDRLTVLWKERQRAAHIFWKRWTSEYIQQLRSAHKTSRTHSSGIKVGDIVLLHDTGIPRLLWKLAAVENIFLGRDGKVRACEVRLANGTKMRRPIQLLCLLEIT